MVPQPPIKWVGAHPNNFTVGRPGGARDGRSTKHWIVGSLESADSTFANPNRQASAHFGVGETEVHQYVSINDTAWADGNWDSNLKTIAVEHQGGPGNLTDAMYHMAAWLHAWLKQNYGVTYSIWHKSVSNLSTQCSEIDLDRIERESNAIIAQYNKPAQQPQWLKNRVAYTATVYAQNDGMRIVNLADTTQYADSRVFARNTSFQIGSKTTVDGQDYYITVSSTSSNVPNGIRAVDVATTPWSAPAEPIPNPSTPHWQDSLVDDPNSKMYVLRETYLIDLETGKPALDKNGAQTKFSAGDIINDVSAHTIIGNITYQLTEYSFTKKIARGILANDLSLNPQSTPPGTPGNPTDWTWLRIALNALIEAIKAILAKIPV